MKDSIRKWLTEQFGSETELIADVYAEYVSATGAKMTELAAAFAARDWDKVDHVAHTLKGNALMTGDADFAEAAIGLRTAAKAADAAAAEAAIARLDEMARALQADA